MRTVITLFLLVLIQINGCARKSDENNNITIIGKVDERTELLSIVFHLAGNPEYQNDVIKSYVNDVSEYFKPYANDELIQFAVKMRNEYSIGYDAVMSLAIMLKIHNSKITLDGDLTPVNPDARWNNDNIKHFVKLLNDFYSKSEFHEFFMQHKQFYEKATANFDKIMQRVDYNWLVKFFGEKSKIKFVPIISMVQWGNFGPGVKHKNGMKDYYCIIGPNPADNEVVPLYTDYDIGTIIHEFTHSFSNILVEKYYDQMVIKNLEFYNYVSEKLRTQAYGKPESLLYEMLVRAVVIKYLQDNNTNSYEIDRLIRNEQENGFIWIKRLVVLLDYYEENRNKYPTFSTFMPVIVKLQNSLSAKELFDEFDKNKINLPFIVSSSIANNDNNVDPGIKKLVITFNCKMNTEMNGISRGRKGLDFMPDIPDAKWDLDTGDKWIISVNLKPDTEYSLCFPPNLFSDKEGHPLKETYYLDFKTRK